MKTTLTDESTLITAARGGDLEAFNQIVLAQQDFLFRLAVNILGDEDGAEDATQDAFISAFRGLGSFRGGSLRAWLTRVVINICYDQLRRAKRHPAMPLEQHDDYGEEMDNLPWLVDASSLPEEQVEARELERAIQQALSGLPDQYRLAAVLVDVQGLSYEEAAEVLRVPVGTVKSRLARARLALRLARGRPDMLPHAWSHPAPGPRARICLTPLPGKRCKC
jgi:RNA polymerase sigma-70 factor (ECF subfamily)